MIRRLKSQTLSIGLSNSVTDKSPCLTKNASEMLTLIKNSSDWKLLEEAVRKIPQLEQRIAALEAMLSSVSYPPEGVVCEHCGSVKLRRMGNRPHPTLGESVTNTVYSCSDCKRETLHMLK